MKLFLDDIRTPDICGTYMWAHIWRYDKSLTIYQEQDWFIVRSYKQFIDYISNNKMPSIISFDHDLGDVPELRAELDLDEWYNLEEQKEYTGLDCAKYLIDYCIDNNKKLPDFIVHSSNPSGAENIEKLLNNFKKFQNINK